MQPQSDTSAEQESIAQGESADDTTKEQSVREFLDRLIQASPYGYADISRLLGRNPAYVQQFIKRGVPRRLSEQDRQILAQQFGISETLLGAPVADARITPHGPGHRLLEIAPLSPARPTLKIDAALIDRLSAAKTEKLVTIEMEGDSMAPTLLAGDRLLIDTGDKAAPRDGLYALNTHGTPIVKRLSVNPATHALTLLSDNMAYPSFADCDPSDIVVIGRVIWVGRQLV